MSMRVLFNSAVLIRPGAATKIDASAFNIPSIAGVGVMALLGEAEGGEPHKLLNFASPQAIKTEFESGDLVDAAAQCATPANDTRITGGVQDFFVWKTNNSTKSSLMMTNATAPTSASLTCANPPSGLTGGFVLPEGPQNIVLAVDTVPLPLIPINLQRAQTLGAINAFPYVIGGVDETITVRYADGVAPVVCTFLAGTNYLTLAAFLLDLNAQLVMADAVDDGLGAIQITSDIYGAKAKIEIVACSEPLLEAASGLTVGLVSSGSGPFDNGLDVPFADFKAYFEPLAPGIVVTQGVGGVMVFTRTTPGPAPIGFQFTSDPVMVAIGADFVVHNGTASGVTNDVIELLSRGFGVKQNLIKGKFENVLAGKRLTLHRETDEGVQEDVSGILCTQAKFKIKYNGAAATCSMTINAAGFATVAAAVPADDLLIPFDPLTCKNLATLLQLINANPNYVATALINNTPIFKPEDLDWVTVADIKVPPSTDVFAKVWDIVDWVNNNSALCTAVRQVTGSTIPNTWVGYNSFFGGTRGGSNTSDWTDGLTALSAVKANQIVPLISSDVVFTDKSAPFPYPVYTASFWQGGFEGTVGAIPAAVDAQTAYLSSTKGRNERQAWMGADFTNPVLLTNKEKFVAFLMALNSPHTCAVGQGGYYPNGTTAEITHYKAWMNAVVLAAMRCGAPLGEPLTWKYMRAQGIDDPFDIQTQTSGAAEDIILAGGIGIENVKGQGFRVIKCVTTYTRLDNDALTEESIVQIWKMVGRGWREFIENIYIGTKGTPAAVWSIKSDSIRCLDQYVAAEVIVPSIFPDGSQVPAYHDLEITLTRDQVWGSVVIQPVSGINFALQTIFLVPATISV